MSVTAAALLTPSHQGTGKGHRKAGACRRRVRDKGRIAGRRPAWQSAGLPYPRHPHTRRERMGDSAGTRAAVALAMSRDSAGVASQAPLKNRAARA
jgi:hypothetical protein